MKFVSLNRRAKTALSKCIKDTDNSFTAANNHYHYY